MSGEAGGILVGGMVLAIAPIIIAGAAAVGITYGAYKAGSLLSRHALEYAKKQQRQKELVVNQCSSQLNGLYSRMREVVRSQEEAHVQYANQLSEHFQEIGQQLDAIRAEHPSAEQLDEQISVSRETLLKHFGSQSEQVRRDIVDNGRERLRRCIEENEKSARQKAELVQWTESDAAAQAMQKASASEMLRDAQASVRLLESMTPSSGVNMRNTLTRAQDLFAQGMYQAAFSNARTIIRESAMLAMEHVQDEMEKDMLEMELRVKLESLREEMQQQRFIEFCDETRRDKKQMKADLNHFSQGNYKKMLEEIDEQIADLDQEARQAAAYEIQKRIRQFDQELEPRARHIISGSYQIMNGYYQRLHVLEVVADFMSEQDYKMDWAMPVGGDASQKLVVHFVQKLTGNTISITLENDADSGDIANMAMEVLTFYGSGREVTEEEKRELRDHLTTALHKAGLGGMLSCKGHVNQPSDQVALNQKETVRNMKAEKII